MQDSAGVLYGWGRNTYGQLGIGTTKNSPVRVPVFVGGILSGQRVVSISAGGFHSLVLDSSGALYSWGRNNYGQLGIGTASNSPAPVPVFVGGILSGKRLASVSAGGSYSHVLDSSGAIYGWGRNNYGQLGDGTTTDRSTPVNVPTTVLTVIKLVINTGGGTASVNDFTIRIDGVAVTSGQANFGNAGTRMVSEDDPGPAYVSVVGRDCASDGTVTLAVGESKHCTITNTFVPLPGAPPATDETVIAVAPSDFTVTTDTEKDGATITDSVETSVTTPNKGDVSIQETSTTGPNPSGFLFLGQEVNITAPLATAQNPLRLVFLIDASLIPEGENETTTQVFKNRAQAPTCTGAPGQADPDPCVSNRALLADGDVEITVLTSKASSWNFGTAATATKIPVEIDIKPGGEPNSYNCASKGVIPVAILSDTKFDATSVDADFVLFGGDGDETGEVHVDEKTGNAKRHVEDVNGDNLLDMVFHFKFTETGFGCADIPDGENAVTLTGKLTGNLSATAGGTAIEGESVVRLVGKK